jgi:hypothetical protein
MQFHAELTDSDYSKFRSYAVLRIRKVWVVYVLAGLFLAWEVFPGDYAKRGIPIAFALIFSVLFAAILSALVYLLSMILLAFLPNRPGNLLGSHTFTLTDSEFQEVNAAGSASVKLELLRRYETAHHVFLMSPTNVGYILPMRDLEANPEFLRVLRERTKSA